MSAALRNLQREHDWAQIGERWKEEDHSVLLFSSHEHMDHSRQIKGYISYVAVLLFMPKARPITIHRRWTIDHA